MGSLSRQSNCDEVQMEKLRRQKPDEDKLTGL